MKEKNKDKIEDIEQKEENKEENDDNVGNHINNDEIELIYYFKDRNFKIFGSEFIENNNDKLKIEYENKEYDLVKFNNIFKNIVIIDNGLYKIKFKLKNIKNVTNMSYMFCYCSSLSSFPDISKWNTNHVTNILI